ncbi:hypothetical protein J6590_037493 [Homalodisca vitripennis]|nr:hypothetical protein J6590_037493 [Homalodisca vitripennis]
MELHNNLPPFKIRPTWKSSPAPERPCGRYPYVISQWTVQTPKSSESRAALSTSAQLNIRMPIGCASGGRLTVTNRLVIAVTMTLVPLTSPSAMFRFLIMRLTEPTFSRRTWSGVWSTLACILIV